MRTLDTLTPRQRQVLALVVKHAGEYGISAGQIGSLMPRKKHPLGWYAKGPSGWTIATTLRALERRGLVRSYEASWEYAPRWFPTPEGEDALS